MKALYARQVLGHWRPQIPTAPAMPPATFRSLPAPPVPPALPDFGAGALSTVLTIEDFASGPVAEWIRFAFGMPDSSTAFPRGREYRKHWEIAMALRTLAAEKVIPGEARLLATGAGNEPTLFLLTNYAREVVATDLYLAPGWDESSSTTMLSHPGINYQRPWRPGRLVVRHMNALDLWFEDCSFDATVSSGSIEHYGDLERVRIAMREAYRVLRPGGVCSLSTEFRLAGPPPGISSALLFDEAELREAIIGSADWEMVGASDWKPPSIASLQPVDYAWATVQVHRHQRSAGLMAFDEINFPKWPHLALRFGAHVWTSCHVALRKPARQS
ncbi:MAG TPA: class I SAM-dependent methyltransferase [Dehalococcoidia bacterium]